jgi:hypothetical protein
MADWEKFKYGGVSYPLVAATTNSLLRDADPALYWATEYISFSLTRHLGGRLAAEATKAGAAIPSMVAHAGNVDPGPFILQSNARARFPYLAIYRRQEQFSEHTSVWEKEVSQWECAYVLPPLNWDQAEKLLPILHAVGQVVGLAIRQGHDPNFQSDAKVWDANHAGLMAIGLTAARYGRYPDAQGLLYHAWLGTIECRERVHAATGNFQSFAGADVAIDVKDDPTDTTVANVVEFDSDVDPPPTGG